MAGLYAIHAIASVMGEMPSSLAASPSAEACGMHPTLAIAGLVIRVMGEAHFVAMKRSFRSVATNSPSRVLDAPPV